MMESAETVLPDPDSPTSATISPLAMLNDTSFTAATVSPAERNSMERLRTSTSGAVMVRSPECLAWIEGIARRLADEDQQRQQPGDRDEGREPQPGGMQIGLALRQQLAQRRRSGRQPEAEEVERGQC